MAKDEHVDASALDDAPVEEPQAPDAGVTPQEPTATVQEAAPADSAEEEAPPTFKVRLAANTGLEAPVALSVPGLYSSVEPLPHPDDSVGDGPTLVETEAGWERPQDAVQSKPLVDLDEFGRLVLTEKPTEVPAEVAAAVQGLPLVEVQEVRA